MIERLVRQLDDWANQVNNITRETRAELLQYLSKGAGDFDDCSMGRKELQIDTGLTCIT